jgi:hypothetical protein
VVTEYTYNDLSFTLSNLKVVSTDNGNRCLMDKAYTYDASGERTVKLTGDGDPLLRAMRAYYGLIQTRNGFQRFSAMFKRVLHCQTSC